VLCGRLTPLQYGLQVDRAADPEEPPVLSRRRINDAAADGAGPTSVTLQEILQVRLC